MCGATHEGIDFLPSLHVNRRSSLGVFSEDGCIDNGGPNIDEPGTKGDGNRSVRRLDATRT